MAKNMTVENVLDILDIADMHSCAELKDKAISFMARYMKFDFSYIETNKINGSLNLNFSEIFHLLLLLMNAKK